MENVLAFESARGSKAKKGKMYDESIAKMIIRHMISPDHCENVDIYLFRVVPIAIYLKMGFCLCKK